MLQDNIVAGLWGLLLLWWLVSAFSAKRTVNRNYSGFFVRVLIFVAILLFVRFGGTSSWGALWAYHFTNPIVQWVGVVIVAAGVGLSIWARIYLGSNWGMPMSEKENAQLVTTGPYAYIRNPIYTGGILGMIGTALTLGAGWFVIGTAMLIYFAYSAKKEEAIMLKLFPNEYPAYKARTKALIPFIY